MEKIQKKILVVVPAYNEEATIGKVIEDFYQYLPEAKICVVNNNSSDATRQVTLDTFAKLNIPESKGILLDEYKKGKANAVKKAFYRFDADIYIMIDGDCTYDISVVRTLMAPVLEERADIVIGDRHSGGHYKKENKRNLHGFGNGLVKNIINILYKTNLKDILSGYRIFNKEFVDNFPIMTSGFELETEITLYALENNYSIQEIPARYIDRPEDSFSKLNTVKDGYKVLVTLFTIFKNYKPLLFFGVLSVVSLILCLAFGIPVIIEFFSTGLVEKFPSAFLSMGLGILSIIFFTVALILDTIVKLEKKDGEMRRKNNLRIKR